MIVCIEIFKRTRSIFLNLIIYVIIIYEKILI